MKIWRLIMSIFMYPFAVTGDVMDLILLLAEAVVITPVAIFYGLYRGMTEKYRSEEAIVAKVNDDFGIDGDLEQSMKRLKAHIFWRTRNLLEL